MYDHSTSTKNNVILKYSSLHGNTTQLTKIDKDALTNVVSDLTKENKSLVKNLSHEYEKKNGKNDFLLQVEKSD